MVLSKQRTKLGNRARAVGSPLTRTVVPSAPYPAVDPALNLNCRDAHRCPNANGIDFSLSNEGAQRRATEGQHLGSLVKGQESFFHGKSPIYLLLVIIRPVVLICKGRSASSAAYLSFAVKAGDEAGA